MHQNQTYHLDFNAPAVKCAPSTNDTLISNLTFAHGHSYANRANPTPFIAWTGPADGWSSVSPSRSQPNTVDGSSEDVARLYVMSNNGRWKKTRTQSDTSTLEYTQVNVTECLLYNATYGVDFSFQFPLQSHTVNISTWLNPVAKLPWFGRAQMYLDPDLERATISYTAVMSAFGKLLVGKASGSDSAGIITEVTAWLTSWSMLDVDWEEGSAVPGRLESLFQNITMSLFSDTGLT